MTQFFKKPPASAGYVLDESFDGSGEAIFSKCRRYRYALTRRWAGSLFEEHRVVIFCGLNPSDAGASDDDQTIRKDRGFAQRIGASAMVKVNLFGWIETQAAALGAARDPIGPDFADVLALVEGIAHRRDVLTTTFLAWGSHPMATRERITAVLPFLPGPYECFGTTADGQPRHTSRIAYVTPRERWKGI
jgi:hypothetical protein